MRACLRVGWLSSVALLFACSSGSRGGELDLPRACAADADCRACPTEGCGCAPTSGACPDTIDACFADPCHTSRPVCRDGSCILERTEPQ